MGKKFDCRKSPVVTVNIFSSVYQMMLTPLDEYF